MDRQNQEDTPIKCAAEQDSFLYQGTFGKIRSLLGSLEEPVSEIELEDLVQWLLEIEDLRQAVTELLDSARFFAFVRALNGPTLDSLLDAEENG